MKIPTYDNFQASPTVSSDGSFAAPSGKSAAQIGAEQLQGLGEAVGRAGDTVSKLALDAQEHANNLQTRSLDIEATTRLSALQFDTESGFMNRRGGDAAAGLGDFNAEAKKVGNEVLAKAANPAVREQLMHIVGARVASASSSASVHASGEYRKYQVQTSQDRAIVSMQAGAQDFANEEAFMGNLGTALLEARAQADMLGWDSATLKLQEQKYQDEAYRLRYDAGRLKDPVGALEHFQRHAGAISPVARVQIYHQLYEAAAPSLAFDLNAAGGVGVVAPDNAPAASKGAMPTIGAALPRGMRNNNPGNLVRTGTPWQGEVQGNDPRFASFETPEAGIRAMGKTLRTYQDTHGLNTVNDIISRWAPATENDTAGYAQTVSKAMGVKPGDALDLKDSKTLTALTKSMIQVENGRQPYTDDQLALGLAAASGDGAMPSGVSSASITSKPLDAPAGPALKAANVWRDPSVPTGNPIVDQLPPDWKLHVLSLARGQAQQDMAGARDALRIKVQDAVASYMAKGFAPNPPTLAEFVRTSGQEQGPAEFAQFQMYVKLGQNLQQVKTLPAASLDALAKQSEPIPGPGFAAAQKNYETLLQAIDRTTKLRQQDPIGYALDTGSYQMKALDVRDPASMAKQLTQRVGVVNQLAGDYGVAPEMLSKAEARALSDTLRAAPVEQQKQYLAAIASGVGVVSLVKTTMQSIAPDQPVMALAGVYQSRGFRTTENRDVADLMLRGQAILTPNKKTDGTGHEGGASLIKMPEASLMLSEFNSATRDAFAGKEQAADLFMQSARAIYAAKSAEEGDYSGNLTVSRWRAAINMATGGVKEHNGAHIVMPYGMRYDVFQNRLKEQAPALAATALNVDADDLRRLPLENVGDGRYLFRRGAGYLVDKDGRPVIADMNPR